MASLDFDGRAALITGGTKGIGLATALALGRRGAQCTLTYRWGSAEEGEVRAAFRRAGAPEPWIVCADAGSATDTTSLVRELAGRHRRVDVLVSNVSVASVVGALDDYDPRALSKSVDYSAWPLVEHLRSIREAFGAYPRRVIGMSSTGPESFAVGYDFVAASKVVLETLVRYLAQQLDDDEVKLNVIRSRSVWTDSMRDTFGPELAAFAARLTRPSHFLPAEEVADAVVALASGLLDGLNGQIITVDRGTSFFDGFMRLHEEAELLGL